MEAYLKRTENEEDEEEQPNEDGEDSEEADEEDEDAANLKYDEFFGDQEVCVVFGVYHYCYLTP